MCCKTWRFLTPEQNSWVMSISSYHFMLLLLLGMVLYWADSAFEFAQLFMPLSSWWLVEAVSITNDSWLITNNMGMGHYRVITIPRMDRWTSQQLDWSLEVHSHMVWPSVRGLNGVGANLPLGFSIGLGACQHTRLRTSPKTQTTRCFRQTHRSHQGQSHQTKINININSLFTNVGSESQGRPWYGQDQK